MTAADAGWMGSCRRCEMDGFLQKMRDGWVLAEDAMDGFLQKMRDGWVLAKDARWVGSCRRCDGWVLAEDAGWMGCFSACFVYSIVPAHLPVLNRNSIKWSGIFKYCNQSCFQWNPFP